LRTKPAIVLRSFSEIHQNIISFVRYIKIICAEEHEQEMLTIKFSLTAFYKRAKSLGTAVKVRK